MPTVQLENGTQIQFDKTPTPQDIDHVVSQMGGGQKQENPGLFDTTPQTETNQQQSQPTAQKGQGFDLLTTLAQSTKQTYENPLVKPVLNPILNATQLNQGPSAAQLYQNLPAPQGFAQKVAAGAGAAVPTVLMSTPISRAAGAILGGVAGATEAAPVIGRLTSLLKDSDLAKAALTGLGYGTAEATALNAQGQPIDIGQYAMDTAGQFLLWSGLAKGGAKLGAKFIPNNLPQAEAIGKALPASLKQAYTPEGIGNIAGGMLAGAMSAPDAQSGLAGAVVGGALSTFNPQEKYQFYNGLGSILGMKGISAITDKFGKPFEIANENYEKHGYENVTRDGSYVDPQNGETIIHQAAKAQIEAYNTKWKELHNVTNSTLSSIDQSVAHTSEDATLLDGIKNVINNKFKTPGFDNKVKKAFDAAYPYLQSVNIPTAIAKKYGLAPQDFKGKNWKAPIGDLQQITDSGIANQLNQKVRQEQLSAIAKKQGQGVNWQAMVSGKMGAMEPTEISYRSLDDLRQTMNKIAEAKDPYESGVAKDIAGRISRYLKVKSDAYTGLMNDWQSLFKVGENMGETQDYKVLAAKLATPHWNQDQTLMVNRENALKDIDNYWTTKENRDRYSQYTTKDLIDRYHAYQTYKNPSVFGLSKTFGQRAILSFLVGGAFGMVGLGPLGHLGGMLAAWKMGAPEAWMPVLEGAAKGKGLESSPTIAAMKK